MRQADQTLTAAARTTITATLALPQADQNPVATGGLPDCRYAQSSPGCKQPCGCCRAAGYRHAQSSLCCAHNLLPRARFLVTASLTIGQAAQTLAAINTVFFGDNGNPVLTQADQTLAAAGNVLFIIIGNLNVLQAPQTLVAAGRIFIGGALNQPQAAQTTVATATLPSAAPPNVPQAANALTAHGRCTGYRRFARPGAVSADARGIGPRRCRWHAQRRPVQPDNCRDHRRDSRSRAQSHPRPTRRLLRPTTRRSVSPLLLNVLQALQTVAATGGIRVFWQASISLGRSDACCGRQCCCLRCAAADAGESRRSPRAGAIGISGGLTRPGDAQTLNAIGAVAWPGIIIALRLT